MAVGQQRQQDSLDSSAAQPAQQVGFCLNPLLPSLSSSSPWELGSHPVWSLPLIIWGRLSILPFLPCQIRVQENPKLGRQELLFQTADIVSGILFETDPKTQQLSSRDMDKFTNRKMNAVVAPLEQRGRDLEFSFSGTKPQASDQVCSPAPLLLYQR